MKKIYYNSNVATIATAIKGLNSTFNVAEFYDSYSYIELLDNGEIEIHLDINNIVNANNSSFTIIDKSDYSYCATVHDYDDVMKMLEESDFLIDGTGQFDVYL